jgi:hypothetical protein
LVSSPIRPSVARTSHPLRHHYLAVGVNAVNLKYRLPQIEPMNVAAIAQSP